MAVAMVIAVEEKMKNNPELKESDLDMLKEWHKKQPHLPPMSDSEFILFLHSNYYRTEPTKVAIDTFFTVRTHVPELFSQRDPHTSKELREIMKVVCCLSLPKSTPAGYKVIFTKLIDSDPSRYVFGDGTKLISMIMDLLLYTRNTYPGYVLVVDMDGVLIGHLTRVNPMLLKKFLFYVQEAIPIRLKSVHFINAVPYADKFLNVAKPFMKKELLDTLFFHTSSDTSKMSKTVPIDILPNEQGGKAGPLNDLWAAQIKEIEKYREWFEREEARKVNEAARPDKAKNTTDIFGVEGSFKKLDID